MDKTLNLECIRADKLDFDPRLQISKIFVDGFYQWLKFFSKDKEKLTYAFSHMFDLTCFFTAIEGQKIAGISAFTDGKLSSVHLQKWEFKKALGFVRGNIAYHILKKQFESSQYPFEISSDMGSIEFVATSTEYRGKGVAETLLTYIINEMSCEKYVLEVADTNSPAVRLYEKLGFVEFKRIKQMNSKRSGVNFLVYMKREFKPQQ